MTSVHPALALFRNHTAYEEIPLPTRSRIEFLINDLFKNVEHLNIPPLNIQFRRDNSAFIVVAYTDNDMRIVKSRSNWKIYLKPVNDSGEKATLDYDAGTQALIIYRMNEVAVRAISVDKGKREAEKVLYRPSKLQKKLDVEEETHIPLPLTDMDIPLKMPKGKTWGTIATELEAKGLISTRATDHQFRKDPRNIDRISGLKLKPGEEIPIVALDPKINKELDPVREHLLSLYYNGLSDK